MQPFKTIVRSLALGIIFIAALGTISSSAFAAKETTARSSNVQETPVYPMSLVTCTDPALQNLVYSADVEPGEPIEPHDDPVTQVGQTCVHAAIVNANVHAYSPTVSGAAIAKIVRLCMGDKLWKNVRKFGARPKARKRILECKALAMDFLYNLRVHPFEVLFGAGIDWNGPMMCPVLVGHLFTGGSLIMYVRSEAGQHALTIHSVVCNTDGTVTVTFTDPRWPDSPADALIQSDGSVVDPADPGTDYGPIGAGTDVSGFAGESPLP